MSQQSSKKCQPGFSLAEVTITLGIIGLIVGLTLFTLPAGKSSNTEEKDLFNTSSILSKVFELQAVESGLIPKTLNPSQFVTAKLSITNPSVIGDTALNSTPCQFTTHPSNTNFVQYRLPNNFIGIMHQNWQARSSQDYVETCVFKPHGIKSVMATIYRTNVSQNAYLVANHNLLAATNGTASDTARNTTSTINTATAATPTSTPTTVSAGGSYAFFSRNGNGGGNIGSGSWGSILSSLTRSIDTQLQRNANRAMDYDQEIVESMRAFFTDASAQANLNNVASAGRSFSDFVIVDASGNEIAEIDSTTFIKNAFINDIPMMDYFDQNYFNDPSSLYYRYAKAYATGWPEFFQTNKNYWLALEYSALDMKLSANDTKISFTNPSNNLTYDFAAHFVVSSPIKIKLSKPYVATVNSTHQFLIDIDGFNEKKTPVFKTSGGLNNDEYWLVLDRGQTGTVKDGIVDGDDLFGDHLSMFKSGYEDLAATFGKEYVLSDEYKHFYIPLKPLTWWENLWVDTLRVFGFSRAPIPSKDLKLMDKNGVMLPASSVIQRLYVEYADVNEVDKNNLNFIRQRAPIQMTNGEWGESADEWFTPMFYLQAKQKQP